MRRLLQVMLASLLALSAATAADVDLATIDGPIGPATAEYVADSLRQAKAQGAAALVLQIDTPGGLDSAMRDIIRAIIASPVPVIAWVGPSGARAASAGTYILYASHVAAMAPGTNLGAATPVRIGGMPGTDPPNEPQNPDEPKGEDGGEQQPAQTDPMKRKMVNDAVAYIRSLAELRGRNADWAERAVREAASLPAREAAQRSVVDFVAADIAAVLDAADGQTVAVANGETTLATAGASVRELEPDWRTELLAVITNPNIAYILMLVGVYGLIFELANPGAVVPGVLGAICLVLALFAFQALPINYAGLGLILLGVAFMIGEAFVPSFGALGLGGVVAFAIGSVILFDSDAEGFRLSLILVGSVTGASLLVLLGTATLAVRAHERPVVSGQQQMIGMEGIALEDFDADGYVRVHGERWWARAPVALRAGQPVRVTAMDGLRLRVEPIADTKPGVEKTST